MQEPQKQVPKECPIPRTCVLSSRMLHLTAAPQQLVLSAQGWLRSLQLGLPGAWAPPEPVAAGQGCLKLGNQQGVGDKSAEPRLWTHTNMAVYTSFIVFSKIKGLDT